MKKHEKDTLAYNPQSCWERYADTAEGHKSLMKLAKRYVKFLSRCKTERETIEYVLEVLAENGMKKHGVQTDYALMPFRNKTLFVARRGKKPLQDGMQLISAHTDTPRLDFKQRPFIEQAQVAQAKTHYYGGIRKYQWLARPLALHGVVVRADGTVINVVLGEEQDEPVFTIADLLPHLAQNHVKQTIGEGFDAEKLNIILAHQPKASEKNKDAKDDEAKKSEKDPIKMHVLQILHEKYGICEEDFISAELQAVPAGPARFVGLDKSLIGGFGHDDRVCVFAALEAFIAAPKPEHTTALILWDKEEIGSEGATGANSRFLQYCIDDCRDAWQKEAKLGHIMLNTKALSADVAAALDPDWQEVHEKQNAALLGYGPCFSKFTGSRGKYSASDADAELVAAMRALLNAKNIPWQMAECGKVDLGGGGTVALFLASYGMQVIDCGPAVLGMHSPFELISCADLLATVDAYTVFLQD